MIYAAFRKISLNDNCFFYVKKHSCLTTARRSFYVLVEKTIIIGILRQQINYYLAMAILSANI
jgi:hypothetical protein